MRPSVPSYLSTMKLCWELASKTRQIFPKSALKVFIRPRMRGIMQSFACPSLSPAPRDPVLETTDPLTRLRLRVEERALQEDQTLRWS